MDKEHSALMIKELRRLNELLQQLIEQLNPPQQPQKPVTMTHGELIASLKKPPPKPGSPPKR